MGGYEAVQMRTVAGRADVALGTLIEAMTRAFRFADPSAASEVSTVARLTERMLTKAMHQGEPSADDIAIARVIGDVWMSNLVVWVTRRASTDDVSHHLELAVRLLMR